MSKLLFFRSVKQKNKLSKQIKNMKRISFYITIILLNFVLGVAFTKIYFVWNIQFKPGGVGSITLCGDGFGRFSDFESHDGEKLYFSRAEFSSEQKAEQCYQRYLQETVQIIERETLFDKDNVKITGERIVAVFPPNEFVTKNVISIISLDEHRIYIITSTSQPHLLTFEKDIRKY